MVNGNYIMYGDRPGSDSEIVDDHVQSRTAERKPRRKVNRTANELQRSLHLAQLDNETDSAKYEKRVKEPRLLRYVSTTDVEEHYVTDKFETYDLKPTEATPRRYAFKKKPRNPADGSVNYAYSRSSSSCSSPSGNLPPIAEHGDQFNSYRHAAHSPPSPPDMPTDVLAGYESKLDKYFTKPKEVKKFSAKGSHPDSLYRVPAGSGAGVGKMARALRIMRWPIALVVVCIALAVFVYFLMPDNFQSSLDSVNATYWESNVADANTRHAPDLTVYKPGSKDRNYQHDTKTPEIDFYDAENNKNDESHTVISTINDNTPQRKLPAPPVFPTHLTPEVQYGNENADTGNLRSPKILHEVNAVPADSTLKPHITQKPEKPLAIYFKDGEGVTTTTTEAISRATTNNDYTNYGNKHAVNKNRDLSFKTYPRVASLPVKEKTTVYGTPGPELPPEIQEYFSRIPVKTNVNFTSGHSKLFGISIEDAEKMQSTTQSSAYNTRVSPTLPTWRDGDDSTTKKYPVNYPDVSQCRSTSLPLCRGVLPYDLASRAAVFDGVSVKSLLAHIEYVAASNCSARFRSFACALLEPECRPPPNAPTMPCYSFCRAIVDSCESEFPTELQTVFDCRRYSSSKCVTARAPCFRRELACGDGSCVPRDWICDGTKDCPAGEDEAACNTCKKNEFRCQSGMCIHKRWTCDGYADCPDGDDEAERECGAQAGEPGEESAGSAPAPAVHRPNKLPAGRQRNNRPGDNESSKELLVTSDSNNALKRNFTRRPSLSRLTPYSPPMLQELHTKLKKVNTEEKTAKKNNVKQESNEDVDVDGLGLFGDAITENGEKADRKIKNQSRIQPYWGRAPLPHEEQMMLMRSDDESTTVTAATKLDSSINKLERVIDGAALLKKAAQATVPPEDYQESIENTTVFEKQDEDLTQKFTSHASPCPSGELRCVDGRCITLAQLCDGTIDCTDHADEDNCYT